MRKIGLAVEGNVGSHRICLSKTRFCFLPTPVVRHSSEQKEMHLPDCFQTIFCSILESETGNTHYGSSHSISNENTFLVQESNLPLPFDLPVVAVHLVHVLSGLLAHLHYPAWIGNKKNPTVRNTLYFSFIAIHVAKEQEK